MQTVKEPSSPRQRGRLLKILGVGFGLAVIIGNTIGGGILSTPGSVATYLPNAWLFIAVWVVGGIYALLGVVSIAELGTMLPRSGGQYVFAHHAFGDYAGFVVGWVDWVSTCGASAFIALVAAQYTTVLFPSLGGREISIALAIVIAFALLQWRGIRWGSAAQNITSLLKALAFMVLIVACFALGGKGAAEESIAAAPASSMPLFGAIILALQAVIYTYDGWTGVIYFSEEVRDPGRNIPRSMFGGVLSVIAIYLLINLAVIYVLPISEVAGKDLALGAAAQVIFGAHGDQIFRSLMIVSLLSAVNACYLMATRVLFAMSRDGLFASHVAQVNKGGTPALSLLISAIITVLFIVTGSIDQVLAVTAFFFVANYTVSFAAVFALRRREPDRSRPYRAWGYPWNTGLSLIGSLAFLAGAVKGDTKNSLYALALLAASYPTFHLLKLLARSKGGVQRGDSDEQS
ncbi:MAG TPA: APC family permease [Blastocatellia bacterium]|nr:APC family permease [Blastocatellia bacterium]